MRFAHVFIIRAVTDGRITALPPQDRHTKGRSKGMNTERVVGAESEKGELIGGQVEQVLIQGTLVEGEERGKHEVEISVEKFSPVDHERRHLRMPREATLLEVLDKGARELGEHLLPSPEEPLDKLHGVYKDHQFGEPLNLDLTLGEFLNEEPRTHHFAVELVLAIQINTRWRIAPEKEMTPKDILALAGLPWQEYSLYYPCDSVDPLAPDTPVKLHRGQRFEAQRDGKYGDEVGNADREG